MTILFFLDCVSNIFINDVTVMQWKTFFHKKRYDHALHNILARICNVITTPVITTSVFFNEIVSTL